MSKIILDGLPAGSVTVSATDTGGTATQALTVGTRPALPAHDAHGILQRVPDVAKVEGISLNIGVSNHLLDVGRGFGPREAAYFFLAGDNTSGNIVTSGNDCLGFPLFTREPAIRSGFWNGGTLTVLRTSGSAGTPAALIRDEAPIIKHHLDVDRSSYTFDAYLPAGVAGASRTETVRLETMTELGHTWTAWVHVLGTDGRWGDPSAAVSATPTAHLGGAATNSMTAGQIENKYVIDPALPVVTNVSAAINADGRMEVTWDEPADLTGVVGYLVRATLGTQADVLAAGSDLYFVEIENGDPILPGDFCIIRKTITEPSWDNLRNPVNKNRPAELAFSFDKLFGNETVGMSDVNNAELLSVAWNRVPGEVPYTYVAHASPADSPSFNDYFMRFDIADTSTRVFKLGAAIIASKPRVLGLWARGTGQMRFDVPSAVADSTDLAITGNVTPNTFFDLTETWTFYHIDVERLTGTTTGGGNINCTVRGPGTIDLDHIRYYNRDDGWMAPTGIIDKAFTELLTPNESFVRTHGTTKTGTPGARIWVSKPHRMANLLAQDYAMPITNNGLSQTLPDTLRVMDQYNVNPWLQIEPYMMPAEIDALFEYLCVPYDDQVDTPETKPWAYRRHAMGDPLWIDRFPKLKMEVGNELWNGPVMAPYAFASTGSNGVIWGKITEFWIQRWKAHAGWTPAIEARIEWVLGGHLSQPFTSSMAQNCPSAHWITCSVYNGGADGGANSPRPQAGTEDYSYASALAFGGGYFKSTLGPAVAQIAQSNGMKAGVYEGNSGATFESPSPLAERRWTRTKAQAIGVIDSYFTGLQQGWEVYGLFALGSDDGSNWQTYTIVEGQGWQELPITALFRAIGQTVAGKAMSRIVPITVPRKDFWMNPDATGSSTPDIPTLEMLGFRGETDFTLVAINRTPPLADTAADYAMKLAYPGDTGHIMAMADLPIRTASSLTLYRLTGAWDAHNHQQVGTALETVSLTPPADCRRILTDASMGCDAAGMPPAEMYFWHFGGTS